MDIKGKINHQHYKSLFAKILNVPLQDVMSLKKEQAEKIVEAILRGEEYEQIIIPTKDGDEHVFEVALKPYALRDVVSDFVQEHLTVELTEDTPIEVMNFCPGGFSFYSPRINGMYLEMENFGDTQTITFGQLELLRQYHPNILRNFKILILNDVAVKALGLKRTYEKLVLEPRELNQIIYKDADELKDILAKLPKPVQIIIAKRIQQGVFAKEPAFTDLNVLKAVQDITGIQMLPIMDGDV